MNNFRTIYEICYDILYDVSYNISNDYHDNEKIFLELYIFLTTENSRYEEIFFEITYFNFDNTSKKIYKKNNDADYCYSSYCFSLYQYKNNISQDANMSIIQDLEELSSFDIIKMFYSFDYKSKIFDYTMDYLEFAFKNYIFRKSCMANVLEQEKIGILLKINPFELINYINYFNSNKFLPTEKYIQKFIDFYDASLSFVKDDILDFIEEDDDNQSIQQILIQNLKNRIVDYFNGNNAKIHEFYSYLFSNIYETLIVLIKKKKESEEKYQYLLKIFIDCNYQFEKLYMYFMNDIDSAFMLIDFFIDNNDDLCEGDLIDRRNAYIEVGNVEILHRLNPYYDEENVIFKKNKPKTKQYQSNYIFNFSFHLITRILIFFLFNN